ncbi:MAG: hypothetical protein L3K17_08530, partial [Thermoplasmata archaeon]|nr:hypothetical protein [Thermoplasmata archaeon]
PNPNGTATIQAHVFFINQAPFTEVGTVRISLNPASGPSCGSGSLNLNVPPNATFSQSVSVTVPGTCDLNGGTITASYSGDGLDVALPPESIP